VLSTRYQDHLTTVLAGRHLPAAAVQTILGSLGGALAVAGRAGGASGALLAHAARAAFMSGNEIALAVGAAVALGGVVLVLARLPLRVSRDSPDLQPRTASTGPSPDAHATPATKKDAISREKPAAAVHVRTGTG
jgi:predicted phage tail protein